jgi:hypothetical protein
MWMLSKDPIVDPQEVNQDMCALRNVRPTLWRQPNIGRLHSRLLRTGVLSAETKGEQPGSSNPTTTNTNENDFVTRLGDAILDDMSDSNSEDEL